MIQKLRAFLEQLDKIIQGNPFEYGVCVGLLAFVIFFLILFVVFLLLQRNKLKQIRIVQENQVLVYPISAITSLVLHEMEKNDCLVVRKTELVKKSGKYHLKLQVDMKLNGEQKSFSEICDSMRNDLLSSLGKVLGITEITSVEFRLLRTLTTDRK